ncbi:MAG: thiamine biosynthesis protein ThiI [Oleiphilaceae bacterium]|jgi:thiamine biosynthesis protein ThiI
MKFIVNLFPEISIKSKPVRKRFVKQLRQNVSEVLKREFDDVAVQGFWDKVEVTVNNDLAYAQKVAETLQRIPGISNIIRVQNYTIEDIGNNFEEMLQLTQNIFEKELKGKTFAVRVKRIGKHSFSSTDLERFIGGGLFQYIDTAGVELKNPEVTVRLEVRDSELFIIEERYEGLGGFPLSTVDDVLSLISGGFDSTVASYLTIKRGLKTHFCFFNLGGAAHEIGVKQVSLYLWEKYGASHRVKFVTVPFEAVVAEIVQKTHKSQRGVVLKRMMLRAAEEVADYLNIQALVMGDSVAQVSSQTLINMSVIDAVTKKLILRPLVVMDKDDIISLSRKIGTEDFAKNMPEYCGVISDKPTTCATEERLIEEEANFDFTILEQALKSRMTIKIDEVLTRFQTLAEVDIVSVPHVDDVVIDIRHPEERLNAPLMLTNNEIKQVPFYEIMSKLDTLDPNTNYLLYCDKGAMSQLHASHLKTMGYDRIAVYAPIS